MDTRLKAVLSIGIWAFGSISVSVAALAPVPAVASSAWLDRFNAWRAAANLPPVTENTTWSQGDYNHSLYMVKNDQVTHYETSTLPYYTAAGDTAARNGNIQVSSTTSTADETSIDWWMGAPFHALGMLDPRLTSTGFGSYREVKSGWQVGFSLDVLRGNPFTGGTYPVFFPGNGSSVPLKTYSGNETPDPLQACPGYSVPVGLPLFVEIGGNVATSAGVHTFTGNGSPLEHCVVDSSNAAVGSSLTSRGAVLIIPRQPLQAGVQYVVAVTVNGVPYTWTFSVSSNNSILPPIPAGWTLVGGVVTSTPAASSWAANRLDAFVRGTDNGLWHRTWDGTTWGGWESMGGVLTSDPSAVSTGPNSIDIFVRGTDYGIWHRTWNGTSWGAWDPLGGVATSRAAAASPAAGKLDIVVLGTDHGLWHRAWDGTAWGPWSSGGGVATSDPSAVFSSASQLDVVVRGTDNGLWHRPWNGTGWGGWDAIGGVVTSSPAIASCTTGHFDIFVRGTDNGLWQRGFNGTAWGGWNAMHGAWRTGPAAVCPPASTTIQLLEVAPTMALVQGTATGS